MAVPRLNVAVVAPPYYEVPPRRYGGVELVCQLLADDLAGRGHQVTVVGAGARRVRGRFVATFDEPQPEGTSEQTRIELLHAARAAAAIETLRPDLVHDHTRLGPLTACGRAAPTVLTVHAALAGPDSSLPELEAVQDWVLPVAISQAQRDSAASVAWAGTVHNGVDPARYEVGRKEGYLLYLGRVSRHKGVHLAIEAARACGRRLLVAGGWTTEEERTYFDGCIRPRLGDDVVWVGEVDHPRKVDLLRHADCLLMPALWQEPFGLVVIEAMACGTPVVALRAGALPELVLDGVTGVLCDEPDELPAAIDRARGLDPRRCRSHATTHFDAAAMTSRYLDLYHRALA